MPALIAIADARRLILDRATPLASEQVGVLDGLDRVLAAQVSAKVALPPFPASAMDGYAVHAGGAGRELRVVGEARAGHPANSGPRPQEAIRISTGAPVPPGSDAVIPQENVTAGPGTERIVTGAEVQSGESVRAAGEVFAAGDRVLEAGRRLDAPALALAIAAGVAELEVTHQPRVEVLCTGDELREPGAPLEPGAIHNSNGPMLVALAARTGALVPAASQLPDDRDATEAALEHALQCAEVVIVCGGVSVGPHDHVKPALAALGVDEVFWGVSLQPGKPTWFGTRAGRLVFGLPGNPVSAAVTFTLFVAPALAALQGETRSPAGPRSAQLGADVRQNPHRDQAIRVRLTQRGELVVAMPTGLQGSHAISSLLDADALALIPAGDGVLAKDTAVALEPLAR